MLYTIFTIELPLGLLFKHTFGNHGVKTQAQIIQK